MGRVWKRVPDPQESRSLSNSGWRMWVSSGAAAVLLMIVVALVQIFWGVIEEWL